MTKTRIAYFAPTPSPPHPRQWQRKQKTLHTHQHPKHKSIYSEYELSPGRMNFLFYGKDIKIGSEQNAITLAADPNCPRCSRL